MQNGKIIEEKEVKAQNLNENKIKEILQNFIGKQEQLPPMYSAIKVNREKTV